MRTHLHSQEFTSGGSIWLGGAEAWDRCARDLPPGFDLVVDCKAMLQADGSVPPPRQPTLGAATVMPLPINSWLGGQVDPELIRRAFEALFRAAAVGARILILCHNGKHRSRGTSRA